MNDDDARRIDVNHCVRESELAEVADLLDAADAGAWRVIDTKLVRHGNRPFEKPEESLRFAARARDIVPRLVKGICVLEDVYRRARVEIAGLRNELAAERTDARSAALARSDGKTGPEWEPAQIARFAELWAALPEESRFSNRNVGDAIATLFRRWLGGETVGEEVRVDVETMKKRLDEHVRFRAEWEAEQKTAIERSRETLRGWIERLEAGEVPASLAAEWARKTKEERRKFLAEKRS